ncbi:MAG: T9SS type B sorting domain-containing protein, partial [Bacteroidales bacterium]|nr:T9SS type B sorting domain-containing protein [Bacteroidales bacterium]
LCSVGDAIVFSVDVENAELYQWYYQAEGMSYWSKLYNNGFYTGVTTSELHVFNVRPQFDLMKFRCHIKGQCDNTVVSNSAQILITDIPVRASLGTTEPEVCSQDSTILLISLQELYQIKSANLRFIYDSNAFQITDFTTYFQNMDFNISIEDTFMNIAIEVDDPINVDQATIASVDISAIGNETAPILFQWDSDETFFIDEIGDTLQGILYNTTILLHKPYTADFGDTIDICNGDRLEVDDQLFFDINWSNGDNNSFIAIQEDGDYWVELIDRNSCVSVDSFHVNVQEYPQGSTDIIFTKPYYCSFDDTIEFEVIGGSGEYMNFSYHDINSIDSIQNGNTYQIVNPGDSFEMEVSWSNLCGISYSIRKDVPVYLAAQPDVSILSNHSPATIGQKITFTALTVDDGEHPYLVWEVDDDIKQVGSENIYITNDLNQSQEVSVTLFSDEKCLIDGNSATAKLLVDFDAGPEIYVPGIVSPNGDGYNDCFKAVFRDQEVYHFDLNIYDIIGRLIYQTNDMYDHWDGRGTVRSNSYEIYTYRIAYSNRVNPTTEEEKVVTGKFLLVK